MNHFANPIAMAVLFTVLAAAQDADSTNQTKPRSARPTCNAGCIPEHVKLKQGKRDCCNEGHETLKCPKPAHYRCGPAPPPAPPSSKIWSFPTGDMVTSSPAVSSDGKVVFVGSWDGNLYAIDAVTGR